MVVENDVLTRFGPLLNRLKVTSDKKGLACAEACKAGEPLLALPWKSCWTREAVQRECPPVAQVLGAALSRHPNYELLKADITWLSLHLAYLRSHPSEATSSRAAHMALFPDTFETSVAWTDTELESLKGSPWYEKTKELKKQIPRDFEALMLELGPVAMESLGVDQESHQWARLVLQQFGLYFLNHDLSVKFALAPGLELLEPAANTPPISESLRLELTVSNDEVIVLSAARAQAAGDRLAFAAGALQCESGHVLMSRGRILADNPFEKIELTLELPYRVTLEDMHKDLARLLAEECGETPRPGCCVYEEYDERCLPVEVIAGRAERKLRVRIRMTMKNLLPKFRPLAYIGFIMADGDALDEIVEEERDDQAVLSLPTCERRALRFIQRELEKMLAQYPAQDGKKSGRQSIGASIIAAEKGLVEAAISASKERQAKGGSEPTESTPSKPIDDLSPEAVTGSEEPGPDIPLYMCLDKARGSVAAMGALTKRFEKAQAAKDFGPQTRKALFNELMALRACIHGNVVGDPAASPMESSATSKDLTVYVHGESNKELSRVIVASLSYDIAAAEKSVADGKAGAKKECAKLLHDRAKQYVRLLEWETTHRDLRRSLSLDPDSKVVKFYAKEIAKGVAVQSGKTLESFDSMSKALCDKAGPTLQALRESLRRKSYMALGRKMPWPFRRPMPLDIALEPILRLKKPETLLHEVLFVRAGAEGPAHKPEKDTEVYQELHDLVEMLLMRKSLLLRRGVSLFGADVCSLLLELGVFSCYQVSDDTLLNASDGAKLVNKGGTIDVNYEIWSNVTFWPVEDEMLVISDFDPTFSFAGTHEPVMYPAEDTLALMSSAPRKHRSAQVLDAHCASGVAGILALRDYADKVSFTDHNQRALRFAAFNTLMNGVHDRASFIQGGVSGTEVTAKSRDGFNTVLACLPFLPNPDTAVTTAGPMYFHGGADGQAAIFALVSKSLEKLLARGGQLVTVAQVANVQGFDRRLAGRIGGSMDYSALIFCGKGAHIDQIIPHKDKIAFVGRVAYQKKLQEMGARTISPIVLTAVLKPRRSGPLQQSTQRVQFGPQHDRLWNDTNYLREKVSSTLSLLFPEEEPHGGEDTLYSMDWGEAEEELSDGEPQKERLADAKVISDWTEKYFLRGKKMLMAEQLEQKYDGAKWDDLTYIRLMGFSPPILAEVGWYEEPVMPDVWEAVLPGYRKNSMQGRLAMVELRGCRCPLEVRDALRQVGCSERLSFDASRKKWRPGPASAFDTLLFPVPSDAHSDRRLSELSTQMIFVIQHLAEEMEMANRAMRIVILLCGAVGPTFVKGHDRRPPVSSSLMGLCRTVRMEAPWMICMVVDSDLFGLPGHKEEYAAQVRYELELHSPYDDPKNKHVRPEEKSLNIERNQREVSYRNGMRYVPGFDLSAQNPIFDSRSVLPLPADVRDGVCVVTGGLGGLGLLTAEVVFEAGMKNIVLSSRSGKAVRDGQGLNERLQRLEEAGANIVLMACDAGNERDVASMLSKIREEVGTIRIVVHSAGQIEDRQFQRQDAESFKKVFQGKAEGALALHKHTLQDPIETFMVFSSVAAQGNPGQTNYSAANVYKESLMRWRNSKGLPGIAIQWPAVADVGMAAAMDARVKPDATATASVPAVKQVLRQLITGKGQKAPVQSCLPLALCRPFTEFQNRYYSRLTARANKELISKEQARAEEQQKQAEDQQLQQMSAP